MPDSLETEMALLGRRVVHVGDARDEEWLEAQRHARSLAGVSCPKIDAPTRVRESPAAKELALVSALEKKLEEECLDEIMNALQRRQVVWLGNMLRLAI